jgi:hypothetical protein
VLNPISAAEEVVIAPRMRGHEWTFTCNSAFPTVILDGVLLTSGRWCDMFSHDLHSDSCDGNLDALISFVSQVL